MTHSLLPRRDFLRAGSYLAGLGALSALSLPSTAIAAPAHDPNAALLQIAAILDRGTPKFFTHRDHQCDCARCQVIRRRGITCDVCGFEGTPVVDGCTCRERRADESGHWEKQIALIESGRYNESLFRLGSVDGNPRDASNDLQIARTMLAEVQSWPAGQCLARPGRSSPNDCCHGSMWCPTCCGPVDDDIVLADAQDLIALIRDVRAVLRAHASAGRT